MFDYSIDDQIEARNKKRAARTKLILYIVTGIIAIAIIIFALTAKPESPTDRAIIIANAVYSNVSMFIINNDQMRYKKSFRQPPSAEDLYMVAHFNEQRGDAIKFTLVNPRLNIYPSNVAEIQVDVTRETTLAGKNETKEFSVYICYSQNYFVISDIPYNVEMRLFSSPLPPNSIFGISH